jgi:ABC-type uncharacterized transport system ATPase subunit
VVKKDAVDTLQRRADDERRQLDTEFERISQGNTSDGDLSEDTHHSALIIEAGLVLAGAPEVAVIVEAAAGPRQGAGMSVSRPSDERRRCGIRWERGRSLRPDEPCT